MDPVEDLSRNVASSLGMERRTAYALTLFVALFAVMYLILWCVKPKYVYAVKSGVNQLCKLKVALWAGVWALGLMVVYYMATGKRM